MRALFEPSQFTEIFLSTSVQECARRDPKGLYAKARAGQQLLEQLLPDRAGRERGKQVAVHGLARSPLRSCAALREIPAVCTRSADLNSAFKICCATARAESRSLMPYPKRA